MQARTVFLAVIAWLLSACGAAACETPAGSGALILETRKPLQGDDVFFTVGFGLRLHPLLQMPRMHHGIDWAASSGTPVTAAAAGRVVEAAPMGEYGNAVRIDHGGGWQTLYGQLSRIDVRAGDCVAAGAVVAKVGSTGLSAGPHLHFEVRQDGKPVDPLSVRVKNEPPETDNKK